MNTSTSQKIINVYNVLIINIHNMIVDKCGLNTLELKQVDFNILALYSKHN